MKFKLIILIASLIVSCNNDTKVKLVNFTTYELDTMNFGLGLDTCLIEIRRNEDYDEIKLIHEVASYYSGEHIEGDFYIHNDTVFLSTKYDKSKDKYPNSHFLSLSTVVYEYHFDTDTIYKYSIENIKNCEFFEK